MFDHCFEFNRLWNKLIIYSHDFNFNSGVFLHFWYVRVFFRVPKIGRNSVDRHKKVPRTHQMHTIKMEMDRVFVVFCWSQNENNNYVHVVLGPGSSPAASRKNADSTERNEINVMQCGACSYYFYWCEPLISFATDMECEINLLNAKQHPDSSSQLQITNIFIQMIYKVIYCSGTGLVSTSPAIVHVHTQSANVVLFLSHLLCFDGGFHKY